MKKLHTHLFKNLQNIEGSGSFVTSGEIAYPYIGLHIKGYGEVGLPVHPDQARGIIEKVGSQAPYGKGQKTLIDTSVRNTIEVDASLLKFEGKNWRSFLKKVVNKVKDGLGLEDRTIKAVPYKLLIYKKGGFFLPHRDTEKEKGMFGTLILTLPTEHQGGELWVRFGDKKEKVDFSKIENSKIGFAAFYADCEHEVKPVKKGYRVCLVFNLLQRGKSKSKSIPSPQFDEPVRHIAKLLKSHCSLFDKHPRAVLLGHQYTPTNFGLSALKGNDGARAKALIQAAEEAGLYSSLGLVTLYQTGEPDYNYDAYSRRYYHNYYDNLEDAPMGEVHDSSLTIEYWGDGAAPGLSNLNITEEDILSSFEIGLDENPIEKDYEGYMGNYGPSIDYWYHYGAVVLWSKDKHVQLLASRPTENRLQWLKYYVDNWDSKKENYPRLAQDLFLHGLVNEELKADDENIYFLNTVAAFLIRSNTTKLLKISLPLLDNYFHNLTPQYWEKLVMLYGEKSFDKIFKNAALSGEKKRVNTLLAVLTLLSEHTDKSTKQWVKKWVLILPDAISKLNLSKKDDDNDNYYYYETPSKQKKIAIDRTTVANCLSLQHLPYCSKKWLTQMSSALTQHMDRTLAYDILTPLLTKKNVSASPLREALLRTAIEFLKEKTKIKPEPPNNWSRPVPKSKTYANKWNILKSFMESPTQTTFDYVQKERCRIEMKKAIKRAKADLDTETIRKGRPYTLRITKNQKTYKRLLKQWQKDIKLLAKLERALNAL